MILAAKEKAKLKLTLAIHTESPIMLEKQIIDTSPLVADKKVKLCQNNQRYQWICLVFYSLVLFL